MGSVFVFQLFREFDAAHVAISNERPILEPRRVVTHYFPVPYAIINIFFASALMQ